MICFLSFNIFLAMTDIELNSSFNGMQSCQRESFYESLILSLTIFGLRAIGLEERLLKFRIQGRCDMWYSRKKDFKPIALEIFCYFLQTFDCIRSLFVYWESLHGMAIRPPGVFAVLNKFWNPSLCLLVSKVYEPSH